MRGEDLDNIMDVLNEEEKRDSGFYARQVAGKGRILVGRVEHFYDKINVAAIRLEKPLKLGDIIEIGTEEDAIRQRITSMQINRKDVDEAVAGDDVGVKLKHKVEEGSSVYKII
ncbi:MAG: hypothetical protein QW774_03940 [Candidatus Micrarchaeaceae archaeon]